MRRPARSRRMRTRGLARLRRHTGESSTGSQGSSRQIPFTELVDDHRRHDHDAEDDLLSVGLDADQVHDVVENTYEQGPEERPYDRPAAAHEARPADHHRGDRLELE